MANAPADSLDTFIKDHVRDEVTRRVAHEVSRLAAASAPLAVYLDTNAAAKKYGVCPRMIRLLTQQGAPHIRIGTAIRFHADELDAFMRERAGRTRVRKAA